MSTAHRSSYSFRPFDALIELWFHVPVDTKQVISETFPQANLFAWYGKNTKPNTTKARIRQSKRMHYTTK